MASKGRCLQEAGITEMSPERGPFPQGRLADLEEVGNWLTASHRWGRIEQSGFWAS